MELIKDLPEIFESFSEQRRNSFLTVKEIKESGTPVVGAYCTYSDYAQCLMNLSQRRRRICRQTCVP